MDKKTFDKTFQELKQIVEKMKSDSLNLDDSILLYKEGTKLLEECRDKLSKTEKEIVKIIEDTKK